MPGTAKTPTATEVGTAAGARRVRLALFCSFYRGYYLLHECLFGASSRLVEVVGVATDDPTQTFVSPGRRLWSYPHEAWEETMVADLAARAGIPLHRGRVKTPEFREQFQHQWRPDLVISGTFGQLIDEPLFGYPRLGFYNTHPCRGPQWPSPYAGPNPFQMMIDEGQPDLQIALHRVDEHFDAGRMVALSPSVAIPPGVGVIDLHKITGPLVAQFVARELPGLIGGETPAD